MNYFVKGVLTLCVGTCTIQKLSAQCPVANFAVSSSACRQERITIQNTISAGVSYNWDFCSGDLAQTPSQQAAVSSFYILNRARTIRIVQAEDQTWYGFALDQPDNYLIRFSFGGDITSTPTVTVVGNPSSSFSTPTDMRFWQEGTLWYAVVTNSGNNSLLLLSFGSDLTSTPTVTNLGSFGGIIQSPAGVVLAQQGNNLSAFVTNYTTNQVVCLNFGSSIVNTPTSTVFGVSGASGLKAISIVRQCNQWVAIATSYSNNQLIYLDFQNGLTQPPVIGLLTIPSASYSFPTNIALAAEGGHYYAFVQSAYPGDVYRIDFGTSITNLTGTFSDLGNLGTSTNMDAFEMMNTGTLWKAFTMDLAAGNLVRLDFPNLCSASVTTYQGSSPPSITYSSSGNYTITLQAIDASGDVSYTAETIAVNNSLAPDIDFSSQNVCVNNNVNFTSINSSGNITTYAWNFGDSNTSAQADPSHTFSAVTTYVVQLDVTATNGCQNNKIDSLTIYQQPAANFSLPATSPICTNQNYTFTNTSTYDTASGIVWQWNVNGTDVSAAQNLTYSISSASPQQVTLTASIPGCSTQSIQMLNTVLPGPPISFSVGTGCQESPLTFTNTSSGSIQSFTWNFGDGNTSTITNPTNTYSSIGSYSVSLVGASSNGCQNSSTQNVTVYSKPDADFSLELPPFSCAGTPSQFTDQTPNLTDSNLSSWAWGFGDSANGTSTQENPTYTYASAGQYTVSFSATTNFGCTDTIEKQITIAPSPVANFTWSPACVNQGTQFTDASGTGIKSWFWQIGSGSSILQNPLPYVFQSPGPDSVKLTVTASNNCISQVTKIVIVPVPLSPSFSSKSTCAGLESVFKNTTAPVINDTTAFSSWIFPDGTGTGSPAQYLFPNTGNFSVTLTVTGQSGCTYKIANPISIVTAPVANFTASPNSGSAPLKVQFTNTSTNATSYTWSFNDSSNSMSTQFSPSFTYTELGDYVVDLTAFGADSCSDTQSQIIHVVLTRVDAVLEQLQLIPNKVTGGLQALFSIGNNGTLPFSNPVIILDISGSDSTIQTLNNLTVAPGQTVSQVLNYTFSPVGQAYVCLWIVEAGDVDLFNNKQCETLDNENVIFAPYPNPTGGELTLDWIANEDGTARITIFTSTGEKAFDRQLSASSSGLNQIQLDVSNLHPGAYLVMFNYLGTQKTFRFVVN